MDLQTVKQIAVNLSLSNKGVEHKVWLNEKEGEFYVSFSNAKGFTMLVEEETVPEGTEIGSAKLSKFKTQTAYLNGAEIKTTAEKTKKQPMKTIAKKLPKNEKAKTIARGNNMFLTEADWKKVDAILNKEETSFSAWSRSLVLAKIK